MVDGLAGHLENKQKIKAAVAENKARLAASEQDHNHDWEMRQLENAGWKDDILFYALLGMYVYSAIDPEGASRVFKNWEAIPEWFSQVTFWMVASILGVKKLGDYVPGLIAGIKQAVKK